MIIINEYDYVKGIMDSREVPKDVSNKRLLTYIAKYYFLPDRSVDEFKTFVFDEMKKFNLPLNNYQEYKYDSYVKSLCEKLLSNEMSSELKNVSSVDIYESELVVIQKGENDKERKLLFTLFVLAKINGNNTGWVNNETKDIFGLANITASTNDRALLIHKLYKSGLISQNHKNDKLGYKVELGSCDEPIILTLTSFDNIGNQYIANFKQGWKMCECCGKLFKVKSKYDGSSKYCKQCAEKITRENWRLSKERLRN